jgi:hypothetical protein
MDCSADGEFVAVASWGCQSGGGDEVIVLENASPTTPTYSIDTPGSMWHVDMDPDGFYFTAAGKHVHANVMGSGADVYMYTMVIQGVESGIDPILPGLSLSPNPCAGQASVGFSLPQAGIARLDVYDLSGRIVQAVTTESLSSGEHSIPVSTDLPDGLYVVSLTFGDQRLTEKLVVNR